MAPSNLLLKKNKANMRGIIVWILAQVNAGNMLTDNFIQMPQGTD